MQVTSGVSCSMPTLPMLFAVRGRGSDGEPSGVSYIHEMLLYKPNEMSHDCHAPV